MTGMIFDYIWHSVWAQLSLSVIAMIILGVVAWFIPPLRRWAIGGIIFIATIASVYAKGARDENIRDRQRQKDAEDKSIKDAKADRAGADADLARGVPDGGNRDN